MKFQLPESLEGLTTDDLDALINEALDEFNELTADLGEDTPDETLETAEEVKAALDTLRQARAAKVADADRRAALADTDTTRPEPVATDDPDPDPEPVADADPAPQADADPAPVADSDDGGSVDDTPDPAPADDPEPVLASGDAVARAAANAPDVVVPATTSPVSLVAAADVPGFANGQSLDGLDDVVTAIAARAKGLPRQNLATAQGGVRQRFGTALFEKPINEFTQAAEDSGQSDYRMVWGASDESRLPDSLVAGGWCAPSETMYDLCQLETVDGLIDVPSFTVRRGGIRYTSGPNFEDIYTACGFELTEAEVIAGDCKDCCVVQCPPFTEIRMDAIGLCVKSPILTDHAYPELTRRFLEGSLVAHAHKVNKRIIDDIVAAAGTPTTLTDAGSLLPTLSQLEFQADQIRYKYRLARNATIEALLPFWMKAAIRADWEFQNKGHIEVSDAMIDAWFTRRNIRPQWLYDFQDITTAGSCDAVLPATVGVILYPAGTWAKGEANVIQLDTVYDSPNLEANQFTALFVEEGILTVQKCTHTCHITVPLTVSGQGPADTLDVSLTGPSAT